MYRYVLNDPVRNTDPLGTDASNGAASAVLNSVQQAANVLGAGKTPTSVGRIDSIDGKKNCYIKRAGSDKKIKAKVEDKLYVGDEFMTDDGTLVFREA